MFLYLFCSWAHEIAYDHIKLIVDRADPSLYDRDVDFHDTELALILDDKKIGNHLKAEMLVGIRM